MNTVLAMTKEALDIVTPQQINAIQRLIANGSQVEVFKDFSVPDGWLGFIQAFKTGSTDIYGGISPEGSIHT